MYVVRIVAYQDYQDRGRPHKWIFTHVGLSAHAHNYCASTDGFLALTTVYFAALFFTLVAYK